MSGAFESQCVQGLSHVCWVSEECDCAVQLGDPGTLDVDAYDDFLLKRELLKLSEKCYF